MDYLLVLPKSTKIMTSIYLVNHFCQIVKHFVSVTFKQKECCNAEKFLRYCIEFLFLVALHYTTTALNFSNVYHCIDINTGEFHPNYLFLPFL